MEIKQPRIGLALGSGGARGLAHIGIIKQLVKAGIEISAVAGSSSAALVGGLYAKNKDIAEVERLLTSPEWRNATRLLWQFKFSFSAGGFLNDKRLWKFIEREFGKMNFYNLAIDFAAVTTMLKTGEKKIFSFGKVGPAIMASMAFPLAFPPVRIKGELYMDGGLVEAVPVSTVKALDCDIVIAVNLDGSELIRFSGSPNHPIQVLEQAISIYRHNLAQFNARHATVKVLPRTGIKGIIGWGGFSHPEEVIASGERAMRRALPELKRKIQRFIDKQE